MKIALTIVAVLLMVIAGLLLFIAGTSPNTTKAAIIFPFVGLFGSFLVGRAFANKRRPDSP